VVRRKRRWYGDGVILYHCGAPPSELVDRDRDPMAGRQE
jgi:hypothetical protein